MTRSIRPLMVSPPFTSVGLSLEIGGSGLGTLSDSTEKWLEEEELLNREWKMEYQNHLPL